MPNHFHFLIHADVRTTRSKLIRGWEHNSFSEGIRMLLSSYTQAINKQEKRTGSLFTQNTKSKCLTGTTNREDDPFIAFHYIHQNPYKAGLVTRMEEWEFSSFLDYAGIRNGTLCNISLAIELLNIDRKNFIEESYSVMNEDIYKRVL